VTLLVSIFSVLFGVAFGSFLNVCICRLPQSESIMRPASHCPACRKPILARDNVPILSWILLRGRCRNCGWRIPWRYPLVELATAALFLLSYLTFGLTIVGIGMALFCFLLLGLAIMDAETLLLPDAFTLPGLALGIAYSALRGGWRTGVFAIVYALASALLIVLIRAAYRLVRKQEGMGLGDAKLLAMIAAWLGPWQTLFVLFFGTLAAAIFGVALVALHKRSPAHSPLLPFGSFLCAAAIYAIFRAQPILDWYQQFFR
jgi:leader peptidase (prepilin peptidase) / N-methyltransferase